MAWLSGWNKRVKLTIDNGDIDTALTWFPVSIHLGTSVGRNGDDVSCVFDELQSDANRKKIAVTKADGETQLYVEIEKWDDANEQADLWVSRDGWVIASDADTDLYLYYDSNHADNDTYVGDTNSEVAENVWDANFVAVYHMADGADTSHIYDSTSNDHDGTKKGAAEPAVTTSGIIGNAQSFDGSDDYIYWASHADYDLTDTESIVAECWVNITDKGQAGTANYQYFFDKRASGWGVGWQLYTEDHNYARFLISDGSSCYLTDDVDLSGDWHYVVGMRHVGDDKLYLYVDGASATSAVTDTTTGSLANVGDLEVGRVKSDAGNREVKGLMDELRITAGTRTAAWIKATYESGRDDLLDWGTEEIGRRIFITHS